MPCIKVKPPGSTVARDFWGDNRRGKMFLRLFDQIFGQAHGSRREGMAALGISRRLYNMYVSGERNIPGHVWNLLRVHGAFEGIDFNAPPPPKPAKPGPKPRLKKTKRKGLTLIPNTRKIDLP